MYHCWGNNPRKLSEAFYPEVCAHARRVRARGSARAGHEPRGQVCEEWPDHEYILVKTQSREDGQLASACVRVNRP